MACLRIRCVLPGGHVPTYTSRSSLGRAGEWPDLCTAGRMTSTTHATHRASNAGRPHRSPTRLGREADDPGKPSLDRAFQTLAHRTAAVAGSSWAFALAALTVLVWALTGPVFGFSETWQLVINTGT